MAQIIQETITINLARLMKDDADKGQVDSVIVDGVVDTLESVVQELVGDAVVVEVNIGSDQD